MSHFRNQILIILLPVFLGLNSFGVASESSPLSTKWEMERRAKFSSLSNELRESLKDKLVIFVAGLWNEGSSPLLRYFGAGLEAAEEDLQMKAIRFYPKSYAFEQNVEELRQLVLKSYDKHKRPIILVGHSKGGLECLTLTLKNSSLILDGKVERVVLLQAALHGSPIFTSNKGGWIAWFVRFINSQLTEGFKCIEPEGAKEIRNAALLHFRKEIQETANLNGGDLQGLWEKVHGGIFHAPSYLGSTGISILTRYAHFWMGDINEYGKNDGVLLVEGQKDERIGRVLDAVESDHSGLVLTHGIDGSEEFLSSLSCFRGVVDTARSVCSCVGFTLPEACLNGVEQVLGCVLGGYDKNIQKAYFIALLGHIYEPTPSSVSSLDQAEPKNQD